MRLSIANQLVAINTTTTTGSEKLKSRPVKNPLLHLSQMREIWEKPIEGKINFSPLNYLAGIIFSHISLRCYCCWGLGVSLSICLVGEEKKGERITSHSREKRTGDATYNDMRPVQVVVGWVGRTKERETIGSCRQELIIDWKKQLSRTNWKEEGRKKKSFSFLFSSFDQKIERNFTILSASLSNNFFFK